MKRILILAFSDLRHDARVSRQVNFLKDHYQLSVVCFDAFETPGVEIIKTKRVKPGLIQKMIGSVTLLLRAYEFSYKLIYENAQLRKTLESREFDLIIANDIESLPLAFHLKRKEKILFDAHEYAPRHFEDKLVWRIFFQGFNQYLCEKYLPQVDAMTTVGDGLAREYQKHFPVKPIVLTNANYYAELKPVPVGNKIKLIHHGGANPSRKLELMIEMMDDLDDRFTLDLMLITPSIANKATRSYLDTLKNLIKNNPRVRILPPKKSHEIVDFIHQYDVGVFLIPPINFNYENTLPNKLFDFIQARLAIAIGPTPEMARLVNQFDLGVVSKTFTSKSLAESIQALTPEKINHHKSQSDKAAKELSAEKNKEILRSIIVGLIGE
jgi:hypothetical protein